MTSLASSLYVSLSLWQTLTSTSRHWRSLLTANPTTSFLSFNNRGPNLISRSSFRRSERFWKVCRFQIWVARRKRKMTRLQHLASLALTTKKSRISGSDCFRISEKLILEHLINLKIKLIRSQKALQNSESPMSDYVIKEGGCGQNYKRHFLR